MLRLPQPGDTVAPLVAPAAPGGAEENPSLSRNTDTAAPDPGLTRLMLAMAVPGILLLVAAWFWLKPDPKNRPDPALPLEQADTPPILLTPAKPKMPEGGEFLRQIEPVVKAFLEAPTMEDALKQVHEPARVAERWKKWLNGEPYAPPGFRHIAEETISIADDSLVSLSALDRDHKFLPLALRFIDGGFKIDWESSAGWSEMTLDEFRRAKPAEPKLFRVILSNVDYYNFGFSDELEWISFRLSAPDGDQSIYGYTKRAGELDAKIRPTETKERVPLTLLLRFPENAPADNQVIIEGQVGMGWIEDAEAP